MNLPTTFNVATWFVDRNVQEGRGPKTAIECGEQKISYSKLLAQVNRVGNALRQLGVRPEERVQLLALDSPEFLYSFFGTIKIGAVSVPTNTYLKPQEYEYLLNDTRARVAIVDESVLPQLHAIPRHNLRYLREILVVGKATDPDLSFDKGVAQAS